jgi:hypothetical protein
MLRRTLYLVMLGLFVVAVPSLALAGDAFMPDCPGCPFCP